MVDILDEQFIMIYVVQFLECFLELEVEDIFDLDKEVFIEFIFVCIKEIFFEQESKVFVLIENGECIYIVNYEISYLLFFKVFVCDKFESMKEFCLDGVFSYVLLDSFIEFMYQIIDQVL